MFTKFFRTVIEADAMTGPAVGPQLPKRDFQEIGQGALATDMAVTQGEAAGVLMHVGSEGHSFQRRAAFFHGCADVGRMPTHAMVLLSTECPAWLHGVEEGFFSEGFVMGGMMIEFFGLCKLGTSKN
nr:hypothetical protein [Nitrospirillum amazonense]